MANSTITTQCCIAGGGPAGMMLGFLLARAGVHVVVLEKHADFFRDFRGDTVHPSTLELMFELGLIDEFLKLPHQEGRNAVRADRRRTRSDGRFPPPANALQIRCADAAMGLPQLPGRARQALQNIRPAHAGRGDGPDRGERAHRRLEREDAGRRAHDPRRPGGRLRRTPFDRARESWTQERRLRGADGRAVVSRVAQGRRQRGHVRPYRSRQADGHVRSRRLLAMRLCHSEGRD